MDEKEKDRIFDIIDDDDFPEDQIYFSDDIDYVGGAYMSVGYAIVEGKGYSFLWSREWGIEEDMIEEDKDAFNYISK